ncbi:MAG TPA: hypothetical protein VGX68_02435 [Thermoanaerobaculia bacterium]|jgi:hypothetical protein|nr:hypothetical protein [Thermoanaerobaculia bacterium]
MSIDRRELDEKTDVSPGKGHGVTAHTPHLEEFDREINVRSILWTGLALVILALVVQLLMWWLLRGFSSFDEKRDVRLTPIEAANPQQPPPEPRLQISPNDDMARMREDEDRLLDHAGWVNRQQGTVRVPIDVAMDAILSRGVSAAQPASPQVPLSLSGREGQGSEGQR